MKFGSDRRTTTKQGLTVVLVSHSMEDIARLVDRLIIMYQGQVVATGEPRKLFQQADELKELGLGIPPRSPSSCANCTRTAPPGEHRHFDCG